MNASEDDSIDSYTCYMIILFINKIHTDQIHASFGEPVWVTVPTRGKSKREEEGGKNKETNKANATSKQVHGGIQQTS